MLTSIKKLKKKGQAGGFNIILPVVIILMITGFVLTILSEINSDLTTLYGGVTDAASTNASLVSANIGAAATNFASNWGTFFSLALLAVIIGIVSIFLVRRSQ